MRTETGAGLTILVVDDEPVVLRSVQRLLVELGHDCRACATGQEAMEALQQEPVDLVISDIRLPEMDGFQILQRVHRTAPGTAVVLMTGYADVDTAVRAQRRGALDFLTKPVSLADLQSCTGRVLALRQVQHHLPISGKEAENGPGDSPQAAAAAAGTAPDLHLWEWFLAEVNERKRREAELEARVRQQAAVAELGHRALGAGVSFPDLLDQATAETAAALDVEFCEVLEAEEGSGELVLRMGAGWPAGSVGQVRAQAGDGSQAAYVLASKKATVVANLGEETRFQPWPALCDNGVVSGISVRIAGPDRSFGLLGVHTIRRRRFSDEDVAFAQAVANVLSEGFQHIEDRRQLQTQAREAGALVAAIDAVAGEGRLDEVLAIVVREAARLVSSERAVLFLYDEAEGALVPRAWGGYDGEAFGSVRVRAGEGLSGQVYATGHSRVSEPRDEGEGNDPWARPSGAPDEPRRDRRAAVPVRLKGEIVGTLAVATDLIRLGQPQLDLLERLGEQIAVAIERAQWTEDLVERNHQLEEEVASRKLAEEALLRSSRLIALGEMSAGMAHELNQPLTVISAVAEGLQIRLAQEIEVTEARQVAWSQDILEQVERMSKLIEHLRVFSRDQSSQPKGTVALNQVVESALGMSRAQLRSHGVALELQLGEELPPLRGDKHRLEEVLLNLLGNARDSLDERESAPEQGREESPKSLKIRTYMRPPDGQGATGAVVLEVQDTGTGIDPADEARLFEPFFTTKDPDRGTGLGLSISYAIVREHGGDMECETRLGEGALFRVTLPIGDAPDERDEGERT